MKPHPPQTPSPLRLQNSSALLEVDLWGGAITTFQLLPNGVNPLSFHFRPEQMPENNRAGAPYQGHFLCLGRWGEPSEGEKAAGMPNHGQFANIPWQQKGAEEGELLLQAAAPLEGLTLQRRLQLDGHRAVFAVEEKVRNTAPLGRPYNMVQHPTLAAPFLDGQLRVDCNAGLGFDQLQDPHASRELHWPQGLTDAGVPLDLRNPQRAYSSVFSFLVKEDTPFGWITAYSPTHHCLIGWLWRREEYPWIHLWQHWEGEALRYRGLEFGTAGIHQPFRDILLQAPRRFGQPTFAWIDAGEAHSRRYLGFQLPVAQDFEGVSAVDFKEGTIYLQGLAGTQEVKINTRFHDFL